MILNVSPESTPVTDSSTVTFSNTPIEDIYSWDV